jgi:hypothetical protein
MRWIDFPIRLASITTRDVLQAFEVRAGQVHYWGAYAADFKVGSDTWGIPDRVTVSPSTRTNKRQVLQKVLLVARGSGWERALNKKIAKKQPPPPMAVRLRYPASFHPFHNTDAQV